MNVVNLFQYALKTRKAGNYNSMEKMFHLDHLIEQARKHSKKQAKINQRTPRLRRTPPKGVKHASK